MKKLTRDGLRARQWNLFLDTYGKYKVLFWTCMVGTAVFGLASVWLLLAHKKGAWISAVITFGFVYGALNALKHPWAKETETSIGPGGVTTKTAGGHPLAGDTDPTPPDPTDEEVSVVESEPPADLGQPAQPQEPPPAEE